MFIKRIYPGIIKTEATSCSVLLHLSFSKISRLWGLQNPVMQAPMHSILHTPWKIHSADNMEFTFPSLLLPTLLFILFFYTIMSTQLTLISQCLSYINTVISSTNFLSFPLFFFPQGVESNIEEILRKSKRLTYRLMFMLTYVELINYRMHNCWSLKCKFYFLTAIFLSFLLEIVFLCEPV